MGLLKRQQNVEVGRFNVVNTDTLLHLWTSAQELTVGVNVKDFNSVHHFRH